MEMPDISMLMMLKKTKDIVGWLEHVGNKINQWEIFRILKWRYVSTIQDHIFVGIFPEI